MPLKIVTSWKTLFQLAGAVGQAKLRMLADPSTKNRRLYDEAVKAHDDYRDICLTADRMIDCPSLRL